MYVYRCVGQRATVGVIPQGGTYLARACMHGVYVLVFVCARVWEYICVHVCLCARGGQGDIDCLLQLLFTFFFKDIASH